MYFLYNCCAFEPWADLRRVSKAHQFCCANYAAPSIIILTLSWGGLSKVAETKGLAMDLLSFHLFISQSNSLGTLAPRKYFKFSTD